MNPRDGGNYTQPTVVQEAWGEETHIKHIAFLGGVEIGRYDDPLSAARAVEEALGGEIREIHPAEVAA